MAETPIAPRLGWMPYEGFGATPIYFEENETPGGAAAPEAQIPAGDAAPPADAPPDAPAGEPPPETPPWEGHSIEDVWKERVDLIADRDKLKERFRPWEEATADLDPEDASFYRDFLVAIKTQDAEKLGTLAPVMRQVLDQLTPAQAAQLEDALDDFDPTNPEHLDRRIEAKAKELYESRTKEREQEQAVAQAVRDMNARLADMAKPDAEGGVGIPQLADPTSAEYATVLWMTKNDSELASIGDPMERLTKAAEKYRDRLDERAQDLLKAKTTVDAVPASSPDGAQPTGAKRPANFTDAKKSAMQRIEALITAPEEGVRSR